MEIEAKFVVLSQSTEEELQTIPMLGSYTLTPTELHNLDDTYFDTSDYRLLTSGYAYRRRIDGDQTHLTLKGLGAVQAGALHRREEIEVTVPSVTSHVTGVLDDRLKALGVRDKLQPLFELQQQRFERSVRDLDRQVGTLSIDRIKFSGRGGTLPFTELEFELGDEGTEEDLQAISHQLQTIPGLSPEPVSKFSRGLVLAVGSRTLRTSGAYALCAADTVADTVRKLFYPLFCSLLLDEYGAYRSQESDSTDSMAATARQLRTLIHMTTPYLRGSVKAKEAAHLLEGLSSLIQALSSRRDSSDETLAHYLEGKGHGRFKTSLHPTLSSILSAPGLQQSIRPLIPGILGTRLQAVQVWAKLTENHPTLTVLNTMKLTLQDLRDTLDLLEPHWEAACQSNGGPG